MVLSWGGGVSSNKDSESRMDALLLLFPAPPSLAVCPWVEATVLFSILLLLNGTDSDLDSRIPGVGL